MKRLSIGLLSLLPMVAQGAQRNIIVDTDVGSDDMMALAFLLSRPEVNIEAITVVNGLAHVKAAARNVLRLLDLAGRPGIPVYVGRNTPLSGDNEFPASWREIADAMPVAELPETKATPQEESASAYLIRRLKVTTRPVSILAIGPLTNIAEALAGLPRGAYPVSDMVVMGGAVRVPGNLSGGIVAGINHSAEWNIYIDPVAARTVFQSGLHFRLVPLDACNKVPFDAEFLDEFKRRARTPLGHLVSALLESSRTLVDAQLFFAWDPLAALALINPGVLKISSVALDIVEKGGDIGRTAEDPSARNMVRVALDAEPASFRKTFVDTFSAKISATAK